MRAHLGPVGLLLCVLGWAACRFEPDLTRFEACDDEGGCPTGYTCLAEAGRCLPNCGAQGPCLEDTGPGADGGTDAGKPLAVVTAALAEGIETMSYAQELVVEGGRPPYSFRALGGLPPGLTLDGGVLLGTPSAPGTFPVAVEVQDNASPPARDQASYQLKVRPLLRVAGPKILVNGYTGVPYEERLYATGGTPPYSFTLAPGSALPNGLTLSSDGGVAGTPSSPGLSWFWVRVTDSEPMPQVAVRELSLTISEAPLTMEIATRSVPEGRAGIPYHYVLRVSNNASPIWSLKSGPLPQGIEFHAETATLQGIPVRSFSGDFTVTATNVVPSQEATFTLTIY